MLFLILFSSRFLRVSHRFVGFCLSREKLVDDLLNNVMNFHISFKDLFDPKSLMHRNIEKKNK